ncbi:uncharacterized protein LOC116574466 isoform X2 [Mustela erminea]|uniref:uncharacterized protein LOC116574466 isoform X2 n=1 Tax=Mustela erminea TaxID=36723 RepID=UPI00138759AC|nr:uncharacterized protein LOC116574466 isoform X2 [Mustela erminea]
MLGVELTSNQPTNQPTNQQTNRLIGRTKVLHNISESPNQPSLVGAICLWPSPCLKARAESELEAQGREADNMEHSGCASGEGRFATSTPVLPWGQAAVGPGPEGGSISHRSERQAVHSSEPTQEGQGPELQLGWKKMRRGVWLLPSPVSSGESSVCLWFSCCPPAPGLPVFHLAPRTGAYPLGPSQHSVLSLPHSTVFVNPETSGDSPHLRGEKTAI